MLTSYALDDHVEALDRLPLASMQSYLEGNVPLASDRQAIADSLTAKAMMLLRKSVYVDQRAGAGCGDQGHEAAVEEQNLVGARVRKVLGFFYPNQDVRF